MKLFSLSLLGLLFSMVGFSQSGFMGTWVMASKTQVQGPEYFNAIPKSITVSHHNDSLVVTSISAGANGNDEESTMTYPLNGQEVVFTNAAWRRKFTWKVAVSEDKKSLTFTVAFYMPDSEKDVDFTRVEAWTIEDGKLNMDKKSLETHSETWEVKAVYEKQ